jgi:hypothetical protein
MKGGRLYLFKHVAKTRLAPTPTNIDKDESR